MVYIPIMVATLLSPATLQRITAADYHRMADIGILRTGEQVELIAGQMIIQKMPKVFPIAQTGRKLAYLHNLDCPLLSGKQGELQLQD